MHVVYCTHTRACVYVYESLLDSLHSVVSAVYVHNGGVCGNEVSQVLVQ